MSETFHTFACRHSTSVPFVSQGGSCTNNRWRWPIRKLIGMCECRRFPCNEIVPKWYSFSPKPCPLWTKTNSRNPQMVDTRYALRIIVPHLSVESPQWGRFGGLFHLVPDYRVPIANELGTVIPTLWWRNFQETCSSEAVAGVKNATSDLEKWLHSHNKQFVDPYDEIVLFTQLSVLSIRAGVFMVFVMYLKFIWYFPCIWHPQRSNDLNGKRYFVDDLKNNVVFGWYYWSKQLGWWTGIQIGDAQTRLAQLLGNLIFSDYMYASRIWIDPF